MEEKKYIVYDEFHWLDPDHLEYIYGGWETALANYNFLKDAHPDKTLGLTDIDSYRRIKEAIKTHQQHVETVVRKTDVHHSTKHDFIQLDLFKEQR